MATQDAELRTRGTFGHTASRTRHPRKGGSLLVRLVPLIFAAVLVSAVAIGLWNTVTEAEPPAPQQLGVYQLAGDVVVGPAAVAQVSKLHGKGVGVVDAFIARYSGPSGAATLYMGEAASARDAAMLLRQMEERIGAGNQYFTDLRSLTVDGVKLFSVRSGQESHYFWQAGKKVLWIGFDRDDRMALAAGVKAFR